MPGIYSGRLPVCSMIFIMTCSCFPWLKYQVDGPSGGRDLLIQSAYQPDKFWHLTVFYKNEIKTGKRCNY